MRRPPHRGQNPRPLYEKARRSSPHAVHRNRAKRAGQTSAPKKVAELLFDKSRTSLAVPQRRGVRAENLKMVPHDPGNFLPVDFPGHLNTIPQRILSNGWILGCRHDDDVMNSMVGVAINGRDQSEFTEIDAFGSEHNGATPDGGLIVGFDTGMATGRRRGYLLYGDTFISFVVPGSTFTEAWDINPAHGSWLVSGRDRDSRLPLGEAPVPRHQLPRGKGDPRTRNQFARRHRRGL
jgi:hypothetical protein